MRPPSETKAASPVLARFATRACGQRCRTASKTPAISTDRSPTEVPSGTEITGRIGGVLPLLP